MKRFTIYLIILALLSVFGLAASMRLPSVAQGPVFATNTPRPPDPLDLTVQGALDQYALRLWTEQSLIELLVSQLQRLISGESEQQDAVRLTLYELTARFPGAPRSVDQRQRIQNLMLAAPRSSVDMRQIVRPYIISEINERSTEFNPEIENSFTIDNFLVQTTPMNLDSDEFTDALISVRYPAEAVAISQTIYKDFILARGTPGEGYLLAPTDEAIPAAPYGSIQDINLISGDLNGNGRDELALLIDTEQINNEIRIYGWRDESITNLVFPGERILYGQLASFPGASDSFTVLNYRQESDRWDCVSEIPVQWVYEGNFFRPFIGENVTYENQPTVGCAVLVAEPVFERPAQEGVDLLTIILSDPGLEEQGTDRANMALALFYLLNQQTDAAESLLAQLTADAVDNAWLARQIDAFALAAANSDFNPVEVCAALLRTNASAACDTDQMIAQTFEENALLREVPLLDQLNALHLPVLETTTIAELGRADRPAVNFNLTGASWWAFGRDPMDPTFYIPERLEEPPILFEEAALPLPFVEPPDATYFALLNRDYIMALNTLDNAQRDTPDTPFSPEALYIRALALDLSANRQAARQAYYDLWTLYPADTWGLLAGAHLELRG